MSPASNFCNFFGMPIDANGLISLAAPPGFEPRELDL
jgi:hypothetical protein